MTATLFVLVIAEAPVGWWGESRLSGWYERIDGHIRSRRRYKSNEVDGVGVARSRLVDVDI